MNTPLRFTKKLGNHRGNPRIFFETDKIQRFGFVPGAKYDMALRNSTHLELALSDKGKRAVCKKAKGARTLSIIDINSQVLEGFRGDVEVVVVVTQGHILITKLPKE